ncbi:MFS transporter [Streptomyces sp. KL116D]|uniref:MFS transporter n=1 Tax=Streptomyces sp. KL116D TaxID=3045152 RepID=UPI003556FC62
MTSTISVRPRLLLAVVLVAAFMGQLRLLRRERRRPRRPGFPVRHGRELELVVGGYAFAYASGLIAGGRLGDLYGHRRVYLTGLILFAATSGLCGLAPTAAWLVIARVLQGFAAAVMIPQVLATISTALPAGRRGWAMGWYGAATGTGSIAGQILGGWSVERRPRRAGVAGDLPDQPAHRRAHLRRRLCRDARIRRADAPRLDGAAAAGIGLALALVLVPFVLGREWGWPIVAVAATRRDRSDPVVVRAERRLADRGGDPILDPALLTVPSLRRGALASIASHAVLRELHVRASPSCCNRASTFRRCTQGCVVPSGITFVTSSLLMRSWVARDQGAFDPHRVSLVTGLGPVTAMTGLLVSGLPTVPALVVAVCLTGFGNGLVLPTLIRVLPLRHPACPGGCGLRPRHRGPAVHAASAGVALLGTLFLTLSDDGRPRAGHGVDAAPGPAAPRRGRCDRRPHAARTPGRRAGRSRSRLRRSTTTSRRSKRVVQGPCSPRVRGARSECCVVACLTGRTVLGWAATLAGRLVLSPRWLTGHF